jgi:vitamin K-dependent gamma-carboxylase
MNAYVRFWNTREAPESLACVRIGIALVVLSDLLQVARLDLVQALWGGGIVPARPLWALDATVLFGLSLASACTLCVGLCSRLSALCLLLCSAQLSLLGPAADRGVDSLVRNVLLVLALSEAGATWSVDAWWHTRSWQPQRIIHAWPRYLLISQIALMYFWAGALKQSPEWTSLGGYSALSRLLADPHLSSFDYSPSVMAWLALPLKAATLATLVFERGAIALPLVLWLRDRAHWVRRYRVLEVWLATGVVFHLALAALLQLGIFPWACLALYPALVRPSQLQATFARLVAA